MRPMTVLGGHSRHSQGNHCREKDKQIIQHEDENVKENVELTGEEKFSADCGYSDGDNIKYAENQEIRGR